MKYLKIILPIILITGLFFHSHAHAYKNIWGFQVPTSFDDVKTTITGFTNKYSPVKAKEETPKVLVATPGESLDLTKIEVSEKDLNLMLSKYARGQRYEQFTLDDVRVHLLQDQVNADISINNTKAKVNLKTIENGKRLEIIDIDMNDDSYFAGIKNSLIKSAFNVLQPKLITAYLKDFHSLKIEPAKVTIFLKSKIESF